ncbi:MAG: FeS-binding protein [Desulfarculus sp.]|nr:MAG: FeS-binding protein [Desulfarculus sp.]
MAKLNKLDAGRVSRWLYGLAIGVALFSGFGQMPLYKRYYLADLPGLGWSAKFLLLSDLHYLAAALLLGLLTWRLALQARQAAPAWSWGPRTWWGWELIGLLVVSGAAKALRNYGVFLPPPLLMVLDFVHLGSAMALAFTGLALLLRPLLPRIKALRRRAA